MEAFPCLQSLDAADLSKFIVGLGGGGGGGGALL